LVYKREGLGDNDEMDWSIKEIFDEEQQGWIGGY
jgi:hypothetical protein